MNLKGGFFRVWVLLTIVWLAFMVIMGWGDITAPIEGLTPRFQPTDPGFPSVREFLANPHPQPSPGQKTWTVDEFYGPEGKLRDQPNNASTAPSFNIIAKRLAEHVARSMILPLIILALGTAIAWTLAGFSGRRSRPN